MIRLYLGDNKGGPITTRRCNSIRPTFSPGPGPDAAAGQAGRDRRLPQGAGIEAGLQTAEEALRKLGAL